MRKRPEPDRQTLFHEAMATTFSIEVMHRAPRYARQAVAAAFTELDTLETQLSRFVEGSDVWRINRLRQGEHAVVALDTFRCLTAALQIQHRTGGAFDVTYASAPVSKPMERLRLTPVGCVVGVLADGVRIDLGGIGKGYALDRMAAVLQEWEVTVARLSASTSTILALDPPPNEPGWMVTFRPEQDVNASISPGKLFSSSKKRPATVAGSTAERVCNFAAAGIQKQKSHELRRLVLSHAAVSGSGIGERGCHIADPRTHEPARRHVRAWARAATATQADALSTAFMVMTREQVTQFCGDWSVEGLVQEQGDYR